MTICGSFNKSCIELTELKYKLIVSMKTLGPYGATCVVSLKSSVNLNSVVKTSCELSLFSFIFSKFLGISSVIQKLRAFEGNPCFWDRYLMP